MHKASKKFPGQLGPTRCPKPPAQPQPGLSMLLQSCHFVLPLLNQKHTKPDPPPPLFFDPVAQPVTSEQQSTSSTNEDPQLLPGHFLLPLRDVSTSSPSFAQLTSFLTLQTPSPINFATLPHFLDNPASNQDEPGQTPSVQSSCLSSLPLTPPQPTPRPSPPLLTLLPTQTMSDQPPCMLICTSKEAPCFLGVASGLEHYIEDIEMLCENWQRSGNAEFIKWAIYYTNEKLLDTWTAT